MIVFIFLALYFLLMLLILFSYIKIKPNTKFLNTKHSFSIIIPAKNEEANIIECLSSVKSIRYDPDLFEVIIGNDQSSDDTQSLVKEFIRDKDNFFLREISSKTSQIDSKINVIEQCLEQAKNDIILIIDSDCTVSSLILSEYNLIYQNHYDFVAGPVIFEKAKTLSSKIVSLDFLSLLTFSAVFINNKWPIFCSGANLSFKKKSFNLIKGYEGIKHIKFSDDDLLLQKFSTNNLAITYLWSSNAIVETKAPTSIQEFSRQRIRWGSKGAHYKSFKNRALMYMLFLLLSSFVVSIFYCLFVGNYELLALLIFSKIILDTIVSMKPMIEYKVVYLLPALIFYSVLHPLYVLIFGVLSNIVKSDWK